MYLNVHSSPSDTQVSRKRYQSFRSLDWADDDPQSIALYTVLGVLGAIVIILIVWGWFRRSEDYCGRHITPKRSYNQQPLTPDDVLESGSLPGAAANVSVDMRDLAGARRSFTQDASNNTQRRLVTYEPVEAPPRNSTSFPEPPMLYVTEHGVNSVVLRNTGTELIVNNTNDRSSLDSIWSQGSGQLFTSVANTVRRRGNRAVDEEAGNSEDMDALRTQDQRVVSLPIASKFATLPARRPSTNHSRQRGYRAVSDSLRATLAFALEASEQLDFDSSPKEFGNQSNELPYKPGDHTAYTEHSCNFNGAESLSQIFVEPGKRHSLISESTSSNRCGGRDSRKGGRFRVNGFPHITPIHTDIEDGRIRDYGSYTQDDSSKIESHEEAQRRDNLSKLIQEFPMIADRKASQESQDVQSTTNHHQRHGAVSIPVTLFKEQSNSSLRQSLQELNTPPQRTPRRNGGKSPGSPETIIGVKSTSKSATSDENLQEDKEEENHQSQEFYDAQEFDRGRDVLREPQDLTQKQRMLRNTPAASVVELSMQNLIPDDVCRRASAPGSINTNTMRKASSRSQFRYHPYGSESATSSVSSFRLDLDDAKNAFTNDIESGEVRPMRRGNIFELF